MQPHFATHVFDHLSPYSVNGHAPIIKYIIYAKKIKIRKSETI